MILPYHEFVSVWSQSLNENIFKIFKKQTNNKTDEKFLIQLFKDKDNMIGALTLYNLLCDWLQI